MNTRELLLEPFAYMPPPGIVDGLTGVQAATRVAGASHSVAEILAHVTFWQSWFLERCRGVDAPMVTAAAEGWPPAGAADWEPLRQGFLDGLGAAVALGSDASVLTRPLSPAIAFPPLARYTLGDALTHMAVHNAHHLGQVVTLRQMIGAWPPPQGSWTW